ncbi:MAG: DUF2784 domain-containing protein [Acidobacteriaceae bacterium]
MRLLAALVLAFHLVWILWVIFGAVWTRGRPWLTGFHIASLVWGMIAEAGPWPCPLTMLEDRLEMGAGIQQYSGGCLVHYLDAIVYPNLSVRVIIGFAVAVCGANLLIYFWRLVQALRARAAS